jgi:hypothetical protein
LIMENNNYQHAQSHERWNENRADKGVIER